MPTDDAKKALRLIRKAGVIRSRDLDDQGIPRQVLRILEKNGQVRRVGRGLYVPEGVKVSENRTLVEAVKAVPSGVICLLSALRLHGLTTQSPFEVWMALDRKAWKPRLSYPSVRVVRFSGKALTEGVEERKIEGIPVRLFTPAKTVADCFKYRNKIGLDVAIEALRDCWRRRKATMDDLWKAARVCRVANVMKPYMEMLAHGSQQADTG